MEIDIDNLMSKPLWQMTGEEFVQLNRYSVKGIINEMMSASKPQEKPQPRIAHGFEELGRMLGCCNATIYNFKRQGVLDDAIVSTIGKKTMFDVDKAILLISDWRAKQREAKYSGIEY